MMDFIFEMLQKYLIDQALVLIPVCYILGNAIKSSQSIDDKYIPGLLIILSIILSLLIIGFSIDSAIQGILAAGAAVLCNNINKQSKK